MGHEIPSIWLKLANNLGKPLLISGFYREWSQNGVESEKMQVEQINKFTEQVERALIQSGKIIIMGDANLCSTKWKDPNFVHKNISTPLLNCLDQNGIKIHNVGNTYLADHILKNGTIPESALDHMYYSEATKLNVEVKKSDNSSTDHLPVITSFRTKILTFNI